MDDNEDDHNGGAGDGPSIKKRRGEGPHVECRVLLASKVRNCSFCMVNSRWDRFKREQNDFFKKKKGSNWHRLLVKALKMNLVEILVTQSLKRTVHIQLNKKWYFWWFTVVVNFSRFGYFFRLGLFLKKSHLLTWGLAKVLKLSSVVVPSVLESFIASPCDEKTQWEIEKHSATVQSLLHGQLERYELKCNGKPASSQDRLSCVSIFSAQTLLYLKCNVSDLLVLHGLKYIAWRLCILVFCRMLALSLAKAAPTSSA